MGFVLNRMNDDSSIPRGGRSHLVGSHVVGGGNLGNERGLALIGQVPGSGEQRQLFGCGRGERCRVPPRDAFGLEKVCGKMFAVDDSSEVDVATRFRRHDALRGGPCGPHPDDHDGHSQSADPRGEWHSNQFLYIICGPHRGRCTEQHRPG